MRPPRGQFTRATVLVGVATFAVGCGGSEPRPVDPPAQALSASGSSFFAGADSPWRRQVAPDSPADPRSSAFVERLAEGNHVLALRKYSVPVHVADSGTPRHAIIPTAPWAPPGSSLPAVPIPPQAVPDPESDGNLAVLDTTSNCVYELYRAARTGEGGWTAEWLNATPADGAGIYPDGLSTRTSGLSVAAGLVWPDELRSGRIEHALVFAYPLTREGGPVGLATRSDGADQADTALPLGAHVVLDPAVDVDALDISPELRTIARALQEYGMILTGRGGGFTIYGVDPQSFAADPWQSTFGPVAWADLDKIPFDRMKVLPLGDPKPRYTGPPIKNRCSGAAAAPRPAGADGSR